ncbi:MAG: pyridoxal phosphate-dependent aminotransferase [Phenylobacterium sp.]|uniref:pyridoxal phosphate-dependent aminotransferase n=1 Tax=Phenylobacterium sp. TaxID=1871053 RepID=UPI001A3FD917|nr:pyridoxal phosphate-dependent aminotransferase [Phenylobacterium sp.]MBL8770442.1 pyridoxal phosphate-dependent aminotransferase [Phenylobacterium sp.]
MTSGRSTGAAREQAEGGDALFDAARYADWVRGTMRVKATRPEVSLLFESTIAEPTELLVRTVREAFGSGVTSRYVSVFADGNRFAIDAVARRYGLGPDQVLPTTGATGALALALRALVAKDDDVLVETPGFDLLARLAAEAGASVGFIRRGGPDYALDLDDLAARLTPRTRVVILTNLHNPSGAWMPPEAIAAAARLVETVGGVLIVDEVYADFANAPPPAASLAANIVTVSSLTKVFGLFALKFGWMAADAGLLARIRCAAPDGDMGVSKLSHAVAAHVLERPAPFEAHWRGILQATRPVVAGHAAPLVAEGLLAGELPPHGCMYFPEVPGVSDTRALARRLLDDFDVLVAPGEYFGAPGHLRIGFGGDPEAVDRGMSRLAAGLRHSIRG